MKNHDQTWYEFQGFFSILSSQYFLLFQCSQSSAQNRMMHSTWYPGQLWSENWQQKKRRFVHQKHFVHQHILNQYTSLLLLNNLWDFPWKLHISDYSCSFQILFSSPDRSVGGGYPTSASSYEQDTRGRNTSGTVCFTVSQC